MEIIHLSVDTPMQVHDSVCALGFFDGVHLGHQQLLKEVEHIAKEKGLEPLSEALINQDKNVSIEELAKEFIDAEKGVETVEDAILGAKDIIAENISDNPNYRKEIKRYCYKDGIVSTESNAKDENEENQTYKMYFDFNEKVNRIPSHRILAINRGEKEEFLKVKIDKNEERQFV